MRRYIEAIPHAMWSIAAGDSDITITGSNTKLLKDTTSLGVLGCSRLSVVTRKDAGVNTLAGLNGRKIGFVTGGFLLNKFGLQPVLAKHNERRPHPFPRFGDRLQRRPACPTIFGPGHRQPGRRCPETQQCLSLQPYAGYGGV